MVMEWLKGTEQFSDVKIAPFYVLVKKHYVILLSVYAAWFQLEIT